LIHEAVAHGERSVEVLSRLPASDSLVLAHGYLSEVYAYQKKHESALEHYQVALQLAERLDLTWLRERLVSEVGPKVAGTPRAEDSSQLEAPTRAPAS
jgi:hypothetical protein